jgi:hypothetical protein
MLKIFKFDKEVYSGAEIRERVHYYGSEADRIFELSKVNIDSAMSEFKKLKDEIKAEYGYYDKMNFQTIVGSFVGNNVAVVSSYVELVSDIVSKLYNTNNKRYLTSNLDEFGLYISFSNVERLLIDNALYGHHQAANVERDLRAAGSGSQKYAFLSRTYAFLINPSGKSCKEMLEVWKRTDEDLFDKEILESYVNANLINKFK